MKIRVKCILPSMTPECMEDMGDFEAGSVYEWGDIQIINDAACREYDWLVVYDDLPKCNVGSICREVEELACPREQTILVTAEPPTIKLYPRCYTGQFGYVLTTHDKLYLPHPNYRRGQGCLRWMANYNREQVLAPTEHAKTKLISTVSSNKTMKHTQHFNRYQLTSHVAKHLPDLVWYGWGMNPLQKKYEALDEYKYHLAIENYLHPYHWSDKISDPILALCLTFYAGDSALAEVLPAESIIPIPIDDPPAALEIIQKAIRDNEYEKRLPAIREARRLILTKYNLFSQVEAVIRQHTPSPHSDAEYGRILGRHRLRRNPFNALQEFGLLMHFRVFNRVK